MDTESKDKKLKDRAGPSKMKSHRNDDHQVTKEVSENKGSDNKVVKEAEKVRKDDMRVVVARKEIGARVACNQGKMEQAEKVKDGGAVPSDSIGIAEEGPFIKPIGQAVSPIQESEDL